MISPTSFHNVCNVIADVTPSVKFIFIRPLTSNVNYISYNYQLLLFLAYKLRNHRRVLWKNELEMLKELGKLPEIRFFKSKYINIPFIRLCLSVFSTLSKSKPHPSASLILERFNERISIKISISGPIHNSVAHPFNIINISIHFVRKFGHYHKSGNLTHLGRNNRACGDNKRTEISPTE